MWYLPLYHYKLQTQYVSKSLSFKSNRTDWLIVHKSNNIYYETGRPQISLWCNVQYHNQHPMGTCRQALLKVLVLHMFFNSAVILFQEQHPSRWAPDSQSFWLWLPNPTARTSQWQDTDPCNSWCSCLEHQATSLHNTMWGNTAHSGCVQLWSATSILLKLLTAADFHNSWLLMWEVHTLYKLMVKWWQLAYHIRKFDSKRELFSRPCSDT